ncbi:NYN domain-containing protein, partial [Rhizobium ruizarguesonis]
DYRKLLKAFQKRGYLLRSYYYTALIEDQEYSSIRPLIDWLDYNGYKVVTKPAKEFTDSMESIASSMSMLPLIFRRPIE